MPWRWNSSVLKKSECVKNETECFGDKIQVSWRILNALRIEFSGDEIECLRDGTECLRDEIECLGDEVECLGDETKCLGEIQVTGKENDLEENQVIWKESIFYVTFVSLFELWISNFRSLPRLLSFNCPFSSLSTTWMVGIIGLRVASIKLLKKLLE